MLLTGLLVNDGSNLESQNVQSFVSPRSTSKVLPDPEFSSQNFTVNESSRQNPRVQGYQLEPIQAPTTEDLRNEKRVFRSSKKSSEQ